MKKIVTLLILFCTTIRFSQSNKDLLSHYKKYYKQMQSQADIQGVINGIGGVTFTRSGSKTIRVYGNNTYTGDTKFNFTSM